MSLKEDADAQDIKVCISTGRRRAEVDRLKFPNDEFYLSLGMRWLSYLDIFLGHGKYLKKLQIVVT